MSSSSKDGGELPPSQQITLMDQGEDKDTWKQLFGKKALEF